MDMDLLEVLSAELAVCTLWHLLWRSKPAVDVYPEALPAEHGVPYGIAELCLRHDSSHRVLS